MGKKKERPRIAILAMGVLGGGTHGDGIPVFSDLFDRLSDDFEFVYYSLQTIDKRKVPNAIKVRQATSLPLPGRVKYAMVLCRLLVDHLMRRHQMIFSISVYPAGYYAVMLRKILKIPVVMQLIALEAVAIDDIQTGNLTIPWLAKITRNICEQVDFLVVVADYQKKLAEESLPTNREIVSLPLRVDTHRFQYKRRVIRGRVKFIHIAYYSPIKDQDTMFRAFAIVADKVDCELIVVGNGYETPDVQTLLSELRIAGKVTFKGYVYQNEIPECFDDAHMLLHPARFETGCAVIQEAMASGVAVCGTRVGILFDIGDEYAAISKPKDVDELASNMMQLILDPAYYAKITNAAYHWIKENDARWSSENYRRFLWSVLNDYGKP
jgi:glycosyltransferase involved in cell wall biosynthesis